MRPFPIPPIGLRFYLAKEEVAWRCQDFMFRCKDAPATLRRGMIQGAEDFRTDPVHSLIKYAPNEAALLWLIGSIAQMGVGAVILSPRVVSSWLLDVGAEANPLFCGNSDKSLLRCGVLSTIAMTLLLFPSLAKGDPGTWAGYLFTMVGQAFAMSSNRLALKYGTGDKPWLVRNTLGKPLLIAGAVMAAAEASIINSNLDQLAIWLPSIFWALGDVALMFSHERATICKRPGTGPSRKATDPSVALPLPEPAHA